MTAAAPLLPELVARGAKPLPRAQSAVLAGLQDATADAARVPQICCSFSSCCCSSDDNSVSNLWRTRARYREVHSESKVLTVRERQLLSSARLGRARAPAPTRASRNLHDKCRLAIASSCRGRVVCNASSDQAGDFGPEILVLGGFRKSSLQTDPYALALERRSTQGKFWGSGGARTNFDEARGDTWHIT